MLSGGNVMLTMTALLRETRERHNSGGNVMVKLTLLPRERERAASAHKQRHQVFSLAAVTVLPWLILGLSDGVY